MGSYGFDLEKDENNLELFCLVLTYSM
ncbi:unnamed protein product, partial [Adineta steineri]